jgi:hypothetical protein
VSEWSIGQGGGLALLAGLISSYKTGLVSDGACAATLTTHSTGVHVLPPSNRPACGSTYESVRNCQHLLDGPPCLVECIPHQLVALLNVKVWRVAVVVLQQPATHARSFVTCLSDSSLTQGMGAAIVVLQQSFQARQVRNTCMKSGNRLKG